MRSLVLVFSLLFAPLVLFAQDAFLFHYTADGQDFARITIGDNGYKFESLVSFIKAENDTTCYMFRVDKLGNCIAMKAEVNRFAKVMSFSKDLAKYSQIDTTVSSQDTLVNGLTCRSVRINYIREGNGFRLQDTTTSIFLVAKQIQNPFFYYDSATLKGLIIAHWSYMPEWEAVDGKYHKTIKTKVFLAQISSYKDLPADFFTLPENCTYVDTVEDFAVFGPDDQ